MYLIILIVILCDFLISYFIPLPFNELNYFYPMLTLTFLVFYFKKSKTKNYLKLVFITGIIYDLLFSYIFLFNTLIFLLFAKILYKVDKLIRYNYFISIIVLITFIFLYDLILFILVFISGYNIVTINDLIYKFTHSLILNIGFYFLLTIIFKNKKILKS